MLWRFYVAARRPTTRRIAETIEAWDDDRRRGTANHETVRRALRGESVGAWQTVEMIFLALCEIADVDPEDTEDDDVDRWNPPLTHIERFHRCWNEAVDEAPMPDIPRTRSERAQQRAAEQAKFEARANARDSWSTNEPPF
ncbi:hypothetical protein [Micromonospora sp. RL09-050-HVF-A]|uniref:hypothetical protein n=1 Tax=Micromonospora sp. RL09-050-HVF-A TaxID=1703433 RepID=UPI001C5F1108|nr:hypothetical protein [Micromonospora sp. RL09-050-HVF-A]MBW4705170.1 hypothetical protein [Micromonospora sp. RL09-050-HVF-A]